MDDVRRGDEREVRTMALATADDRLLTRREVAEILGFREQTLARWRWEGRADRPPEVKVGRAVRYRASEVRRWIAERGDRPSGTGRTRNPRT